MTVATYDGALRGGSVGQLGAPGLTPASVGHCQVLGDRFGFLVQGVLFAVVMSTLAFKWRMERPRRSLRVFVLDSSKQVIGAGAIHVMNMLCAIAFASRSQAVVVDECAWYWVNIMVDTTFGVLLCYWLLKGTEQLLGYDSGDYGKKAQTGIDWDQQPDYWKWGEQIVVWCMIVMLMKLIVVLLLFVGDSFWIWLSVMATHWITDPQLRLLFVMVVTPTLMNMFQFCITDSFLKYQQKDSKV
mmetsp:Transcript_123703/g.357840  ORF Transcript_123703/g.357840 Transcript_123703/m.357840 type:complete len:242 (+) Transcript_123703:86-811(+)